MACMAHSCRDCKYEWFDNSTHFVCPACGSTNTTRVFDEPGEDDYEEDDECES